MKDTSKLLQSILSSSLNRHKIQPSDSDARNDDGDAACFDTYHVPDTALPILTYMC